MSVQTDRTGHPNLPDRLVNTLAWNFSLQENVLSSMKASSGMSNIALYKMRLDDKTQLLSFQPNCNCNQRNEVKLAQLIHSSTVHRGVFGQFPFRWIYYCHSCKSTGKEAGKTHLCACICLQFLSNFRTQPDWNMSGRPKSTKQVVGQHFSLKLFFASECTFINKSQ